MKNTIPMKAGEKDAKSSLKPCKQNFDFSDVEALMKKYLDQWGIKQKPGFAELYFKKMVEIALSKPVAIELPHNLGDIKVIKHAYKAPYSGGRYLQPRFLKKEVAHINKFGYADYSLVWARSLFLAHHTIETSQEINEEVRKRKLQ